MFEKKKEENDKQREMPVKILDGYISAGDIVKNPDVEVANIPGKYTIIREQTMFNNMVKAINIMAAAGWKCVNITGNRTDLAVLMERQ
jgi:hypothetical protein